MSRQSSTHTHDGPHREGDGGSNRRDSDPAGVRAEGQAARPSPVAGAGVSTPLSDTGAMGLLWRLRLV